DALALADVLLARVDDGDLAGQIETDIARALWLAGRPDQLIERIDSGLRRRAELQPAVAAAKHEGRHHDALRHFRELCARSGASYLAEEIMALQLVDRYDHAQ